MRDNFPEPTKRALRERAALLCSNPTCGRLTVAPGSEPSAVVLLGTAAHIHGAAPNGPRFNSLQTTEERSSIENGIWLCTECSVRVDRDESAYPASLLRDWKREHEAAIAKAVPIHPLSVRAESLDGFLVSGSAPQRIDSTEVEGPRHHVLMLRNETRGVIRGIEIRIQFPEVILEIRPTVPVGVAVRAAPARSEWVAAVSGPDASVTIGHPRPIRLWQVGLSELLSGQEARLLITGIVDERPLRRPTGLTDFLEGNLSIPYGQSLFLPREFLAELVYDSDGRRVAIGALHASHDAVPRTRILGIW